MTAKPFDKYDPKNCAFPEDHQRGCLCAVPFNERPDYQPPQKPESGWLIEAFDRSPTGRPMWLRLYAFSEEMPKPEWTSDSSWALRFGRKEDAAIFAKLYPQMCCLARVTEHQFISPTEEPNRDLQHDK